MTAVLIIALSFVVIVLIFVMFRTELPSRLMAWLDEGQSDEIKAEMRVDMRDEKKKKTEYYKRQYDYYKIRNRDD